MDFHNVTKEVVAIVIVALAVVGIVWLLYYVATEGDTLDPDIRKR